MLSTVGETRRRTVSGLLFKKLPQEDKRYKVNMQFAPNRNRHHRIKKKSTTLKTKEMQMRESSLECTAYACPYLWNHFPPTAFIPQVTKYKFEHDTKSKFFATEKKTCVITR